MPDSYYPRRVDTSIKVVDPHESRQVIEFGEKLRAQGNSVKEEYGIDRRIERAARFIAGGDNMWPKDAFEKKKHKAKISLNFIHSIIERKAGMLTDTRPKLDIRSKGGFTAAANTIRKIIADGIWYERSIQQVLTDGIVRAQRAGFAPCYIPWDDDLDYGRGDVGFDFLLPDQVTFDSSVRRLANVQDGEYVIIETVRPLAAYWALYGERGELVKPDDSISGYSKSPAEGSRIKSPMMLKARNMLYSIYRKPSSQESQRSPSAIPQAREYQMYFRDRSLVPGKKFNSDGTPNYVFPRKRVSIWSGDVLLYDGPSRYWDGLYPVEFLDWGIETDHPFGESEVDLYRGLQEAVNLLISGVVAAVGLKGKS
mgnify:FL=1